jgi:hypothetical protein
MKSKSRHLNIAQAIFLPSVIVLTLALDPAAPTECHSSRPQVVAIVIGQHPAGHCFADLTWVDKTHIVTPT